MSLSNFQNKDTPSMQKFGGPKTTFTQQNAESRARARVVTGREEEEGGAEGLRAWAACRRTEAEGYYANSASIARGKHSLNACPPPHIHSTV